MYIQIVVIASFLAVLAAELSLGVVDQQLQKSFEHNASTNIFIRFHGGNLAALKRASSLTYASRGEKIDNIVTSLKEHAASSQSTVVSFLSSERYSGFHYKQIWATNEVYVEGATEALVAEISKFSEVAEIREELLFPLEKIKIHTEVSSSVGWNLERIEADKAWELPGGNTGEGVVVTNIDTGVLYTHEALKVNFRKNYGWFDPFYGSKYPNDVDGHGTFTTGVMAGRNGIGVAPGAQWTACRGCSLWECSEIRLKQCGQWVLCPTTPTGESPDCSKAPQVVQNPWVEAGNEFFNDLIAAWYAADIVAVFALGNSGSDCGSLVAPGDQPNTIAVGSTNINDNPGSGKGPSLTGLIKPDLVAPGSDIRSAAMKDTYYVTVSGTSVASSHVAGVAALIFSRNPNATYDQVVKTLRDTADRNLPDTGVVCGEIPSTEFPNNQYGYGRLNARKALQATISG